MYMVPQNYKVTDNMNDREYIDEGLRIVTPHDEEEQDIQFLLILGQIEDELPDYLNKVYWIGSTFWDMAEELYEAQFGLANSIMRPKFKSPDPNWVWPGE